MSEIDTTGQYWMLYLVRENEETGYILTLNTKNYTKEDMLAWRRVFNFRESMASYSTDSKGFYRPVYVFMVRTDATDGLEIAISCEKWKNT